MPWEVSHEIHNYATVLPTLIKCDLIYNKYWAENSPPSPPTQCKKKKSRHISGILFPSNISGSYL